MIASGFAIYALKLNLFFKPFLYIALSLFIYNAFCWLYLKFIRVTEKNHPYVFNRFANAQISIDWLALTLLVHYSGGLESPLLFYFIFHIIIAAVLLSYQACYIQASLASLFMVILSYLEYSGKIAHFYLWPFTYNGLYGSGFYILGMLFFFISTLYIASYLATSVTRKLRLRDKELLILKEDLELTYSQLKEMDKLKSEFVLKITHELRAPLSAVQSLLKVILSGYAGEIKGKVKELISRSEKRIVFLLDLVRDLLDLAQGKTEILKRDLADIDVNELIKKSLIYVKPKIEAKNLVIKKHLLAEKLILKAKGDDLDLIFDNLLDNAAKYTQEGGKVEIDLKQEGSKLIVKISDTGIGIPKEEISEIFSEFYRASNAKEIEKEGTGLGLSIVKNIVEKYKGTITVESELNQGTTFKIILPL